MTELEKAKEQYKDNLRELDSRTLYDDIDVDSARLVAFKAGAEWQSKHPPWISVEERLPDPNEMVLCLMKSNEAIVSGFIQIIRDHKPKVLTSPDFEFEDNMGYEPVYWMHIPELQKGGQNEQ